MPTQFIADVTWTFGRGTRIRPGNMSYDVVANKRRTVYQQSANVFHGELHLYGPTTGVFFYLDIDATGTVQQCYRYPVFGSFSVDLFSWLEQATWNGTLVIDGVTTDEWACPSCPANNKLWVSKDALPVRDSNLSGASAFTRL